MRKFLARDRSLTPTRALLLAASAVFLPLAGCGIGTGAAVSSAGGAGGGSNSPPTMAGFDVVGPKTAPAELFFSLSDPEGNEATVEFFYRPPGQAAQPMAHLTSLSGNPTKLATTKQGVEYTLPWDFAAEDLLPGNASFTDDVLVFAKVQGAPDVIVLGANATQLGLGNDPPVLDAETPPAEVGGVVPVLLHMSDSSSDAIDIRAEFDIQGDDPDLGWQLARPAGLHVGTPTPAFAFEGVVAKAAGSDIVFFWDTEYSGPQGPPQLPQLERDVQLRFTPVDPVVSGTPALTDVFRVDNNAAPIALLQDGAFISNPDALRGIPIPFTVIDEESDTITMVFQWAREGEAFPQLPGTPEEILGILSDPDLRQQYRICSQYPHSYEGRVVQIDETHVRLPELRAELSLLVQSGLVGREIEFVRPSSSLMPVSDGWTANPLVRPVGILPAKHGTHALVLDEEHAGSWRLVEVGLFDGTIERTIVIGAGTPSALCFEKDEQSVLVASTVGTTWALDRVVLATGTVLALVDATSGPVAQGKVRGIASIGTNAAVLTVGSSLIRVDWPEGSSPSAVDVRTDLAVPWGVVADPRNEGVVLVAENQGQGSPVQGRIVSVDLATHVVHPVVIWPHPGNGLAFPQPRGIALLRKGTRLLALCESGHGTSVELRAVDLGRAEFAAAYLLGEPLDAHSATIATGESDHVLATSAAVARLYVAGGAARRATITGFDGGTATATLSQPVTPAPDPSDSWRLRFVGDEVLRVESVAEGQEHSFVWDSRNAGAGRIYVRATALDADVGSAESSTSGKALATPFLEIPSVLGGLGLTDAPSSVHSADLDGDGDLDFVSANYVGDTLTVFWQTSPGIYGITPTVIGGPGVTDGPNSVRAADLDGDGDLDLVSANYDGNTLTVFWQTAPGVFDATPEILGGPGVTDGPNSAQAADLDGDGDLDLASANFAGDALTVFWQTAPGVFGATPKVLGGTGVTNRPRSLQLADIDGDGDLDLVSANLGSLTVFWQTAPGGFGNTPTIVGEPGVTVSPVSVEAADLDGDGDLDLVSADAARDALIVFWQTAPGVLGNTPIVLEVAGVTDLPLSVQAADLDADGDLDLVSANSQGDSLAVFWQTATGVFGNTPTVVGGPGVTDGPVSVQAADFDGDGDLDVVSANNGYSLTVFWQGGPGVFDDTPTVVGGPGVTDSPSSVKAADLDGDGDLDLVSANVWSSTLTVLWQTAPGVFGNTPTIAGGPGVTGSPVSVQAADLDGDGSLDLVSANRSSQTLAVFWQTAPGVFGDTPTVVGGPAITDSPRSVQSGDFDGDGDLDLVSANYFGDSLTVFWQTTPRVFDKTPTFIGKLGVPDGPVWVQAADLDGDGDLDLVSANSESHTLTVFWQIAPGVFDKTPAVIGGPGVTESPFSVQAADLDRDGDLDLVSTNTVDRTLAVIWQTAPGVYSNTLSVVGQPGATSSPGFVHSADLDGDGDLDLISANVLGNPLSIFWQTAPGIFDDTPTFLGESSTHSTTRFSQSADLDRDGDLDLVLSSDVDNTLTVFWGGR